MKYISFFLLAASLATGAEYNLDASRKIDWTLTGVPGGIAQYQAGGASERTNLIDVTASPYFADGTGISTTGTVAAGGTSLTVASPTGVGAQQLPAHIDSFNQSLALLRPR